MNVHDINVSYLEDVVAKLAEYWADLTPEQVVRIDNAATQLSGLVDDEYAVAADAANEEVDTNSEV
jgi:hypothetical protein